MKYLYGLIITMILISCATPRDYSCCVKHDYIISKDTIVIHACHEHFVMENKPYYMFIDENRNIIGGHFTPIDLNPISC